jgi:hypothetical protein
MTKTIQHISRLIFVLLFASSLSVAQGVKTLSPLDSEKVQSRKSVHTEEEQQAQEEKVKTLRMSTLTRTIDSIKKIDEPALRISARNGLLKYLIVNRTLPEQDITLAGNIARESLADFSEHFEEIMPSLAEYLFSDLAVWIKEYQPALNELIDALEKTKLKGRDLHSIQALMALPGGDVLAAQRITQLLEAGKEVPVLVLYLNDLIAHNSQEVMPLLSTIVDIAAQGRLSFETLLSTSDLYIQPQTPLVLKQRFVRMVVARTQPFNLEKEPASQSAYYLLTNMLPTIKQAVPELYSQAVNQRLVVYASFTKEQLADEQRSKRLSESSSLIEDLIAEADQTKSKLKRNQLLAQAAQLAMQNKRFALCLEAVEKLDLDAPGISADFWKDWNDQFVRDFVKAVLAEKKPELAEQGTEHISGPYAKVQSMVMIIQYWMKVEDASNTRRLLTQARKAADIATDYVDRAKAFFLLSALFNQTDSSEKMELLESAIKALNSVSLPERGDDLSRYQTSVWRLNGVEYQVATQFKDLTKNRSEEALTLLERIDKPESRTFALLGILHGLRDLSRSARG